MKFKHHKHYMMGRFRYLRAPGEINGMPSFESGTGESQPGGGGSGAHGMPFDGGFGGGQGPLIGQDDDQQQESNDDIFAAFAPPTPKDGEQQQQDQQIDPYPELTQEQIQAAQTETMNIIRNMRIPDNIIPENFDPNDRQQMQQVMTQAMQATIAQSLSVVFRPVQMAMTQMNGALRREMQTQVAESRTGIKESSIFEQTVPEVNNPKYAPLIQQLEAPLKAAGKPVAERAKTIRKMLNQLGVNDPTTFDGNQRRTANPNGGQAPTGRREGTAALDAFFGAFQQPQQRRQGQQ